MVDMTRFVVRTVHKMLKPYVGRMRGMIRRAVMGGVSTSTRLPSMQVTTTADDADDDVEMFEQYGFASVPPNGSEGVVLRVGGVRANSIGICFGDRGGRIEGLAQGEVAIYNASNGAQVVIRNDGNIEVTPGDGGVVQLGGPTATLAVARETDPVQPTAAMTTWMAQVDTAIGVMAGAFNAPAAPMASLGPGAVVPSVSPGDFGLIESGGEGSTST